MWKCTFVISGSVKFSSQFKTTNKTKMSVKQTLNIYLISPSQSFSHQAGVCSHAHSPSRWTWRLQARWPAHFHVDGAEARAGVVVVEAPVIWDKRRLCHLLGIHLCRGHVCCVFFTVLLTPWSPDYQRVTSGHSIRGETLYCTYMNLI